MGFLDNIFKSVVKSVLTNETPLQKVVKCPECGNRMTFRDSELDHFKAWECEECGEYIYDSDLWFFEENDDEEDDDDYETDRSVSSELDIPEGCRACGGDWPNCITSCNMYED